MAAPFPMVRTASVSPCGAYRYRLGREWAAGPIRLHGTVLFIMLNPSTADGLKDDATVRRCIGYARRWGYKGLEVANLFALRATDPRALKAHPDPVGPDNHKALCEAAQEADLVVAAWGGFPLARGRAERLRAVLAELASVMHCPAVVHSLGPASAKGGFPKHPLYQPADAPLLPYWEFEKTGKVRI